MLSIIATILYESKETSAAGPKEDAGNEVAQKFMTMVDMSTMSAEFYPIV